MILENCKIINRSDMANQTIIRNNIKETKDAFYN